MAREGTELRRWFGLVPECDRIEEGVRGGHGLGAEIVFPREFCEWAYRGTQFSLGDFGRASLLSYPI